MSEAVPLRVLPRTLAYAYWAKVSQNGPEPLPKIGRPGAARFQLQPETSST